MNHSYRLRRRSHSSASGANPRGTQQSCALWSSASHSVPSRKDQWMSLGSRKHRKRCRIQSFACCSSE